jgi:hypothetical protein
VKAASSEAAFVLSGLCGDQGGGFAPGWAEVAEASYGGGDQGEGVVDLFGGGEAGEGEADAGPGAGGGETHGGEDVGGFGGAGLAGGASADGEAFEVEGDDEGFGFDVVEVEAAGVGDAGCSGSVDAALFDLGEDALFEAVAEGGEGRWSVGGSVFGEPLLGYFSGFAEGDDAGYVFGSGAALALVGAAVEHGGEADVASHEEGSDAFGGVDLVTGDCEEVNVFERAFGAEVEGETAYNLDGVGVEERARSVGDGGQRRDGLDDAGLVVGEHDADELCVGADGGQECGGFDDALRGARKERDFDVLFGEGFGGAEDGVVLDAGGDKVSGFAGELWASKGAEEGEVVALGAAGGEDDLGGAAVEEAGDAVAGVIDGGAGELALLVDGAGVAVVLEEEGTHGLEYFREERRCGVGV